MTEATRTGYSPRPNGGDDAAAISKSRAIAFNKNWNICFLPNGAAGGAAAVNREKANGTDPFSALDPNGAGNLAADADSAATNKVININSNVVVF